MKLIGNKQHFSTARINPTNIKVGNRVLIAGCSTCLSYHSMYCFTVESIERAGEGVIQLTSVLERNTAVVGHVYSLSDDILIEHCWLVEREFPGLWNGEISRNIIIHLGKPYGTI